MLHTLTSVTQNFYAMAYIVNYNIIVAHFGHRTQTGGKEVRVGGADELDSLHVTQEFSLKK